MRYSLPLSGRRSRHPSFIHHYEAVQQECAVPPSARRGALVARRTLSIAAEAEERSCAGVSLSLHTRPLTTSAAVKEAMQIDLQQG